MYVCVGGWEGGGVKNTLRARSTVALRENVIYDMGSYHRPGYT